MIMGGNSTMEVLNHDQFMALVYRDLERKKAKKIAEAVRKEKEYRQFKIDQSIKFGSKYTKRKNIRR